MVNIASGKLLTALYPGNVKTAQTWLGIAVSKSFQASRLQWSALPVTYTYALKKRNTM